ncbi:hypothetical protein [Chryseobacterium cheonjiense]|uniref:Glycosyltransferase family 4 protein n=1 Tax=Chryseobacterium cheonjiense TaxID=2728845 RepID=A0A7Y0FK64_9FLAO|nr:hypothetical protein [Chryseobacterium cheonjiense]NML59288.1 glycosyltransferase family 4 protein [Chryseobacterium cheonjiense]
MKRIAYIEIDTHAEIAQSFMEIMKGSEAFSVDYYFSKKIKDQITDNAQSVYLSDSSMISDQLKSRKYDLVIIGTVHRYFNTFSAIAEKYNTAVIVHNINFISASNFSLLKNIFKKDSIYRLKLLWKEGLLYSSKIYGKAKGLLVLDGALSSERFRFLPLFYTKQSVKTDTDILTIVIPGGVSQKRRDYKKVFSEIKKIEQLYTDSDIQKKQIEFVFLGKADHAELNKLTDLERSLQYVNITYFPERVSQADFEQWMQKADVLWCPIQQETEFFSQKEIYGRTKMTGNIGDAIKFGKLAVFPENYRSSLDFIIPEQSDLIRQFEELRGLHFDFQKDYSKQTVRQNLENLLDSLSSI